MTDKTLNLVQTSRTYLKYELVNFVWKFPNFHYYGNRG